MHLALVQDYVWYIQKKEFSIVKWKIIMSNCFQMPSLHEIINISRKIIYFQQLFFYSITEYVYENIIGSVDVNGQSKLETTCNFYAWITLNTLSKP